MFVDQKFKEVLPEKTVDRIKGILDSHGIETVESGIPSGVRHCHSMRVAVKDVEFGANGKGMTEAYSKASGYAEFMERLQGGYLSRRIWRDQALDFPDERQMRIAECVESCGEWIEAMQRSLSGLFGREIPRSQILRKLFEADGEAESVACIPFYDPKNDRRVYFPKKAMAFLYNTNGLAAGNDLVEAAVQSLSEIYERHNLVRMFFGSYVPPTIPEEYLRGFPKIWEIIEDLKATGLRVLVKDCSLGEPFPLVAAVVIDQPNHAYHVHLGAFPAFEIALERSFTEMFQGRTLQNVTDTDTLTTGDARQRSNAELIKFLTHGCGRYPLSFFSDKPSYPFRPFPDRADSSNEALLKEYLDYFHGKGCPVYFRDISHLGFPSIRVVIPGVSEIMPTHLSDRFPLAWLLERYKKAPLDLEALSEDERFEYRLLLDYLAQNYGADAFDFLFLSGRNLDRTNRSVCRFLGRMSYGWLEWERDQETALGFIRAAFPVAEPEDARYLSCYLAFREQLRSGADRAVIRSALSELYGTEYAAEAEAVLAAGENPFTKYLVHCSPESCPSCPYRETCSGWTTDAFIRKIRAIVARFDSAAAYEGLRRIFAAVNAENSEQA